MFLANIEPQEALYFLTTSHKIRVQIFSVIVHVTVERGRLRSFSLQEMSEASPLERKASLIFDPKLQRQRKEEQESRAARDKQLADYASKHQLQELFDSLSDAVTAGGPPGTEAEAQRRLFVFLNQRKQHREACKRRFEFSRFLEVDIRGKISFSVVIDAEVVMLGMRNAVNDRFVIEDKFPITWELFAQWETVLHQLTMHSTESPAVSPSYVTIRTDGRTSAFVAASAATKKIVEDLWNVAMELRQSSKGVNVFQPL